LRFRHILLGIAMTQANMFIGRLKSPAPPGVIAAGFLCELLLPVLKLFSLILNETVHPPADRQEQKDQDLHPEGILPPSNTHN
jgi:hypothetical protein